jgi:single stranded DNA-binding protein
MNNQLQLIGYVGKDDPETKVFPSGKKLTRFSMAVKDFSNKEDDAEPLWIDCEAWNGTGERVAAVVTAGREISVYGRLAKSEYTTTDKEGITVRVSKPVLKLLNFHLHGAKPKEKAKAKTKTKSKVKASSEE